MVPPQLPIEVLSNITALIAPAYHPPHDQSTNPTPPNYIIDALDPHPVPYQTALNVVSALSKSSHELLEASRPWLWEDVDVRSGRGWLAIVNALTEEVVDQPPPSLVDGKHRPDALLPTQAVGILHPRTPISPPDEHQPLPAADAHVQPNTIPGGLHRYISHPAGGYPSHYNQASGSASASSSSNNAIGIHIPTYDYSPPQPAAASLLLTPPGSRNSSPHYSRGSSQGSSPSPAPPGASSSQSLNKATSTSARSSASSRLRGRSRSPRRSVGFDTKGISSVLDRSSASGLQHPLQRAVSLNTGTWPRRMPLERRRSSLSRARAATETGYDEDDEDDEDDEAGEEDDKIAPLPNLTGSNALPTPPIPLEEIDDPMEMLEHTENANPDLLPPPGPYIRHINFNNFRTIGSRRTQDEAVRGRYVTAGRLEGVIKNCPNLVSLCMTEYVDSSLSFPVIEDIIFRGYRKPRAPRRQSISNALTRSRSLSVDPNPNPQFSPMTTVSQLDPPRPDYVPYEDETEEDMWKRRGKFTPLQALDLTGCVSAVFTTAMAEFWNTWLNPDHDSADEDEERGRSRSRHRLVALHDMASSTEDEDDYVPSPGHRSRRTPRFAAMRRLSLRACTTLDPAILYDVVLAFPNLTHLDLSNTRVPTSLITTLTESPPRNMRLQSLSLARCARVDPTAIIDFLCLSPATQTLVELNLYMNPTQANTIDTLDFDRLLTAPCIKSGKLRYLDVSSAGITMRHLHPTVFPPQPSLLSLGLSHVPSLPLRPIADFLLYCAPNVEILTLNGTALESSLNPNATSIQTTLELHAHLINPLTTVPFSLANLSLSKPSTGPDLRPGATRLRVVELSAPVRKIIADGGSGEWKVVKSKGGRGWYVDLSAGWIEDLEVGHKEDGTRAKRFVRHLPTSHPRRQWLSSLASAGGRVGSAVGWHSRKMEVVRGMGMLGREEGMAGVGGFAFDD